MTHVRHGEHYTRRTVSATAYCNKCKTQTPHRVDGVRRGPCLRCIERAEAAQRSRGDYQRGMLPSGVMLPPSWDAATRVLFWERYEERAGIKEFCGNMPRADAEREAENEVRDEIAREKRAREAGLFA